MKKDFDTWLNTMRASINSYDFYVDFPKVYANIEDVKVELNIMNSLIASPKIEEDFLALLRNYPQILKCLPLLLAVRQKEIYASDSDGTYLFDFKSMNYSAEQYAIFMKETGLFDLIAKHIIHNLVDYAMGIEVGLDSNGRKNRGGHQMEAVVEKFLKDTGAEYYKEMYLTEIEEKWSLDLSRLSADHTSTKRFDFVVKEKNTIYLIETNFYGTQGSKLNETARSYELLATQAATIPGIEFVWITDGNGWHHAKRNLRETYNVLEHLYNIKDLENGALSTLLNS
jgi:type II restriction enzyme